MTQDRKSHPLTFCSRLIAVLKWTVTRHDRLLATVLLAGVLLPGTAITAHADAPPAQGQARVDIKIEPVAALHFTTSNTLSLDVPPSKSTVNTAGAVGFIVSGNAQATLIATPDQFVLIPGSNNGWMGKAVHGSGSVGYQIQLTFPSNGISGSPRAIATLPLFEQEGTLPPLSVPLPLTAGDRPGSLDLLASADWTPDGGLPLPGVYVGQVILTLTASNP